MHGLLERKVCKEKYKSKKNQNSLYIIASMSSRRCGSYRMYLKGDSPHQTVMIMCELGDFLISQIVITWSCNVFHTQHAIFFATLDTCAGIM